MRPQPTQTPDTETRVTPCPRVLDSGSCAWGKACAVAGTTTVDCNRSCPPLGLVRPAPCRPVRPSPSTCFSADPQLSAASCQAQDWYSSNCEQTLITLIASITAQHHSEHRHLCRVQVFALLALPGACLRACPLRPPPAVTGAGLAYALAWKTPPRTVETAARARCPTALQAG
jgi:hypothetical protein